MSIYNSHVILNGNSTKWFDGITDSMDMSFSKLWEMVKEREA